MKRLASGLAVLALSAVPAVAVAESWHPFSRSPNNVYMADVDSITVEGDISSVRVARAPLAGAAGDYSHTIETYQFQCGARSKWRTAGVIEYGPDGLETDQYPEIDAAWEDVRSNTAPGYLEMIVCKGSRVRPPIWPTVKEFVDAGRT